MRCHAKDCKTAHVHVDSDHEQAVDLFCVGEVVLVRGPLPYLHLRSKTDTFIGTVSDRAGLRKLANQILRELDRPRASLPRDAKSIAARHAQMSSLHLDGMNISSIARVVGCDRSTVLSALSKKRKKT